MNTYVILRRSGWTSPDDLGEAAARSKQVGEEEMSDDIRWIRSYVMAEPGGALGTVCVYQATSEEAIREHASGRSDIGDLQKTVRSAAGRVIKAETARKPVIVPVVFEL